MPRVKKPTSFRRVTERHLDFLKRLSQTKRPQRFVRDAANIQELKYLSDAAHNILQGTFQLRPPEFEELKKLNTKLKKFGWPTKYGALQRRNYLKRLGGKTSQKLTRIILKRFENLDQDQDQEDQDQDQEEDQEDLQGDSDSEPECTGEQEETGPPPATGPSRKTSTKN